MVDDRIPNNYDYYPVAKVDDIHDGERLFLDIDGVPVVIFNVSNNYFAISDVCTHDNGALGDGDLEDCQIVCPRHGARFDIRTGKALTLPAIKDTRSFPVRVNDDNIEIGIMV